MKLTLQLKDLIYVIIISALLLWIFKKDPLPDQGQVSGLIKQRDSIIEANMQSHIAEAIKLHAEADSSAKLAEDYRIKDSISTYKYNNERKKRKNNSVIANTKLMDSIAIANKLRHLDLLDERRNHLLH